MSDRAENDDIPTMDFSHDETCDNCGHETAKTGLFECHGENAHGPLHRVKRHLCYVCSSTFLSQALNYPLQCSDVRLYQSLGWIANEILIAIRTPAGERQQAIEAQSSGGVANEEIR
jgi:hypothetical protein